VSSINQSQIWQEPAFFRKTGNNKQWWSTLLVSQVTSKLAAWTAPDTYHQAWQNWALLHTRAFSWEVWTDQLCNCTHVFLLFSGQQALLYLQPQSIDLLSCRFFFLHCSAITRFYVRLQLVHLQQDSFMIWERGDSLSISTPNHMGVSNYFS